MPLCMYVCVRVGIVLDIPESVDVFVWNYLLFVLN